MTKFTKENLISHTSGYECWVTYYPTKEESERGLERGFVARFKYGGKKKAGPFCTFVRKNFTVEEYMRLIGERWSPQKIVESKGYIEPSMKKELKAGGYPITLAGKDQYWADRSAQLQSRRLLETNA